MISKSKRQAAFLLALCMMVCLLAGCKDSGGDETAATTTAATTTTLPTTTTTTHPAMMEEELTVRDGPGFSHNAIGGVAKGEGIVIIGHEGDWFKIQFGDGVGYVNAHYVAVEGQPNASQMQEERPVPTTTTAPASAGVINADKVSVLAGPDAAQDAIGEFTKGQQVTILGREGDWYKVQFGGGFGYVDAKTVDAGKTTTTAAGTTGSGQVTTTTAKHATPPAGAQAAVVQP